MKYAFLAKNSAINQSKFSLTISESDYGPNETVLNNLIGTLIKYNATGKLEPYLAESFSTSNSDLTWSFKIRDNLFAENGIKIDASLFKNSLEKQLKMYSASGEPLDFSLLDGWLEFKESNRNEIIGIQAKENYLIFKFTSRPSDLLEALRMPYFGLWLSTDDSHNSFKNFLSTGAYKVDKQKSNDAQIYLIKRKPWFSNDIEKTSEYVEFNYISEDQISNAEFTILEIVRPNPKVPPDNYISISGIPTAMMSMVLSPDKNGPFKDLQNRQAFVSRFKKHQQKLSNFLTSDFFFPSATSHVSSLPEVNFLPNMNNAKLEFAFPNQNLFSEVSTELENLISSTLSDTNAKVTYRYGSPMENSWRQRLLSNKEFDARFNGVDIGGHINNLAIKMIFCSKLGVSYPDPSGEICKLSKKQDTHGGKIEQDYINEFNQILLDDSVVVPLMHFGTTWYVSDQIVPSSFPSTVVSPLLEAIEFK
ncbi:MAG: ABC transporter substrate-binding protein [Pseudobdellovibrio sp.]